MVGRLEVMVKPTPLSSSRRAARMAAFGQDLVFGQQRAVDIGDDEGDPGHGRFLPFEALLGRSELELADDVVNDGLDRRVDRDRHRDFRPAAGGSSVLNWLASRSGGMKWCLRRASRSAISACVPSR